MAPASSDSSSGAGLLSGDNGVRDMSNRLAKLANTALSPDGAYRTLADLGVSTNRDGTLKVDTTRLNAAIAADPEGVTQLLNPTVPDSTHPGVAGALKSVTDYLSADSGPLATSSTTYDKLKTALDKDLEKLDEQMTNYQDRLTQTYSAMQTRLLALKATQTYLTQQISVWTNSNNN